MDDKQLEQRLEFLQKSYERVPSTFDADEVLNDIRAEKKIHALSQMKTPLKRTMWQRFGVASASIACLLIIGILVTPFIQQSNSSKQPINTTSISENKIEDMIKLYEERREEERTKLHLTSEEFRSMQYVQSADAEFEFFWKSKKILEYQMSQTEVNNRFDQLLSSIMSPSEMILHADEHILHESEEKSLQFLLDLQQKITDLETIYNQAIARNHTELKANLPQNGWSKEALDSVLPSMPRQFAEMTEAFTKEGITILPIQNGRNFTATFQAFFPKDIVHPVTQGYITYLDQKPFLYGRELAKNIEEYPPLLNVFDSLLLNEGGKNTDNPLYDEVKGNYVILLFTLIRGSNTSKVFNDQGIVTEEYQKIFKEIQQPRPDSISSYLIEPIINEFEVTGWKNSDTWMGFTYNYIEDMIAEINTFGFRTEETHKVEPQNEPAVPLNGDFFERVHGWYKLFAGSHDQELLHDISPTDLVGLYYYSQELGDMETQYELFVKDDQKFEVIPREEFLAFDHQKDSSWRKLYTSFTFQSDALENSLYPGGTVIMTLASPTNEQSEIGFRVFMTKNGWRASFMPTQ